MAEVSYPSSAHNSRNVTDAEYELLSSRFSDDGVYGDPTESAVVSAGSGLQVLVRSGAYASVRGHLWDSGTSDTALTIAANASGSTRIDWVTLRLDRSTWTVRATVLEGAPGAGAPALTRDIGSTGTFDVPLALVTVTSGAASVTVTPYTLYVGTRIRPTTAVAKAGVRRRGEISYVADTGAWEGWDGTQSHTIHEDTGRLTILPGFDTWEQNYECFGRRVGNVVTLRLWYRRVGGGFLASDASGSKMGVLPAALVSTHNNAFAARFGSGQTCWIEVRNNGEIWASTPDRDVPENRVIFQTCTYIRETD